MAKIIPGILVKSEKEYIRRLRLAEHVSDLIQVDIVDGKFAKNKTVGIDVVRRNSTSASVEIQLMVNNPNRFVEQCLDTDFISRIIFPLESENKIEEVIYLVKKHKKQVGISLNPDTPVSESFPYLEDVDILLLMTGRPGYSGQKLGANTYERIKSVKAYYASIPIEIDIGVNATNAKKLANCGAGFLVASSALYEARDFRLAFELLEKQARVAHN